MVYNGIPCGSQGAESVTNSTSTPLLAGGVFTGTSEQNDYPDVFVTCKTDQDGMLYVDMSIDGTNWDLSVPYNVSANTGEFHKLIKGNRYFRIRFTNTSTSNQTYLRIGTYYGSFGVPTSGLSTIIQQDADAINVRSISDEVGISNGLFNGYSIVNKFGVNSDIDSGSVPEDIWEGSALSTTYTGFANTAQTVSIFSDSVLDTAAGTGARQVRVTGLDSNFNIQQETINTNGLVPSAGSLLFIRVHTATVASVGSLGVNQGNITIRQTTTTSNVFAYMMAGRNQTNVSAYTVPVGCTAYMRSLHCSVIRNTTTAAVSGYIWTRAFGMPFRSRRPFGANTLDRMTDTIYGGLVFTEKSDLVLRIDSASSNNLWVTGGYDLLVIKNT